MLNRIEHTSHTVGLGVKVPATGNALQPFSDWTRKAVSAIKEGYARSMKRREDRDAFKNLLALDERMLKDIGVSRNDVIWASNLPLSINASEELEKIARRK